ncbi:putative MFS family arabinose efflux permease [Roseibium hamelinense]|uniref:Putative MFS family arabinose efflux permease n=1 Tax=Roseibium hamelinense TaxID=150831 RepID=A0A562SQ88_9HYPH|nr:MFS transporter [Roseibium hamelinense]MTI44304.1 MFS transporter [Roseibium hamelinense]TWI82920.1 putative MFS family arabinose efflux permease [Roseibium hamelinense]
MTARTNRSLLGINFFAGDVVAGLGPYLAIYLLSAYHWKPGGIGMALAVGSIATVIVQTPAGAIIDATRKKKLILAICAVLIGISSVAIVASDDPVWLVYTAQIAIGIAGAFLGPGIAAVTLGTVGPDRFTAQTSANQAWNHTGNVFGAAMGAAVAVIWLPDGVFWLIAGMSVGMLASILMLDSKAIDHDLARGGVSEGVTRGESAEGIKALLTDRRLIVFAISVVIFHFANAAMLPLVSQKLAQGGNTGDGIAFTSACIIAAQFLMIPMALLCGAKADTWGRKPLFLAAFMILPIRGFLYTLSDDSYYLVAVQALDGIANGIFGMIFLLILADVTRGTGRFNAAQGALTTLIGIGATLSNVIAGWVSQVAGYSSGFLFLAGIAVIGALIFAFAMPETAPDLLDKNKAGDANPPGDA